MVVTLFEDTFHLEAWLAFTIPEATLMALKCINQFYAVFWSQLT